MGLISVIFFGKKEKPKLPKVVNRTKVTSTRKKIK